MMGKPGLAAFQQAVGRWLDSAVVDPMLWPKLPTWAYRFCDQPDVEPCRAGADPKRIRGWEYRYGYGLPKSLRSWLVLSDGLYKDGPLIHPLTAIGPMIPFARVRDLLIQPESWFELGNPGTETVCIDLGYRWPGGDFPIFASGDDARGTLPRVIASGFVPWFLRLLEEGGREFWLDPGFLPLGDPWVEHRRQTPLPDLPDHLRGVANRVRPLVVEGADDRAIASELGISRGDVEVIFRHIQHLPAELAGS